MGDLLTFWLFFKLFLQGLKFSLCKSFNSFNLFQDSIGASVASIIMFLSTHVLNFCWCRSPKIAIIKIQGDQIAGTISQDIQSKLENNWLALEGEHSFPNQVKHNLPLFITFLEKRKSKILFLIFSSQENQIETIILEREGEIINYGKKVLRITSLKLWKKSDSPVRGGCLYLSWSLRLPK